MNEASVTTASREIAVRRSRGGTATMIAWRMIAKDGTRKRLETVAKARSGQYPTKGAVDQQHAAMTSAGPTVRRRPIRSTRRPRQGPETAAATVALATTSPAAAYVWSRVSTRCRVRTTPLAQTGTRTRKPRTRAWTTPEEANTER